MSDMSDLPSSTDVSNQAQAWEDTNPQPTGPPPHPSGSGRRGSRPHGRAVKKRDHIVEAAVLFLLAEHVLLSEIVEAVEEVVRLCRLMLGEATFVDATLVPIQLPPADVAQTVEHVRTG